MKKHRALLLRVALVLLALGAPAALVAGATGCAERAAEGAYTPDITYRYFSNAPDASLPALGTLVYPDSGTSAVVLGGGQAWNATGGTAYLMLFDDVTTPDAGIASVWTSPACTNGTLCTLDAVPPGGVQMFEGAWIGFSQNTTSYDPVASSSVGFWSIGLR